MRNSSRPELFILTSQSITSRIIHHTTPTITFETSYEAVIHTTMMEKLFAPATRYRDLYNSSLLVDPEEALPLDFTEVELATRCEDLLNLECTWEDFCTLARKNSIVWMGDNIFVQFGSFSTESFAFSSQRPLSIRMGKSFGNDPLEIRVLAGYDGVSLVCECLLHLLASSAQTTEVRLTGQGALPISASALLKFQQQTRNLQQLSLWCFTLLEDQCRALVATPTITSKGRPLEIELFYCNLYGAGATDALVEAIRHNRGPTKLERCEIDTRLLADALRGNTSVKALTLRSSYGNAAKDLVAIRALVQGLVQNCGLVRLDLSNRVVNDANWKALCMSLKTHPTLEVLGLRTTTSSTDRQARDFKTTRKNRMLDLEEMLKVNTLIHTIELGSNECDESLLQHFIRPRLKRNLYLPRLSAMKNGDSLLRAKLLRRALESKQESPDALWMFISQNKDIVACFSSSSEGLSENSSEAD
jgi:hypothetical protein